MKDSILLFIEHHGQWAALIVFLVAFLESVAIIGLLVPGWVLLVGVGTLIGADVLDFYPIVIAAYLGAVIGEYLSYLLGYHYHEKVLAWNFVAKHEKLIESSRRFFHEHGVSGVFIGRFFGPTRAVIPLIAGISEMPRRTFFWVNLISGLLWAPVYLIPGILVGAAVALDNGEGNYLLLFGVSIAIAMTVAWNYAKAVWRQYQQRRVTTLMSIKMMLAWGILIVLLIAFYRSPYWAMSGVIFEVLLSKL